MPTIAHETDDTVSSAFAGAGNEILSGAPGVNVAFVKESPCAVPYVRPVMLRLNGVGSSVSRPGTVKLAVTGEKPI